MRASGSNNSCQDYLAQLGFMLSKKAMGKVGANSGQKRGLPGTRRESPQLPVEAFPYLSYRCWQRWCWAAGEGCRDKIGETAGQPKSHNSQWLGEEKAESGQEGACPLMPPQQGSVAGTMPVSQVPILRGLRTVPHLICDMQREGKCLPAALSDPEILTRGCTLRKRGAGRVGQGGTGGNCM